MFIDKSGEYTGDQKKIQGHKKMRVTQSKKQGEHLQKWEAHKKSMVNLHAFGKKWEECTSPTFATPPPPPPKDANELIYYFIKLNCHLWLKWSSLYMYLPGSWEQIFWLTDTDETVICQALF